MRPNAVAIVTLRVLAPKATEITVTGEILNGGQPAPMAKGEDDPVQFHLLG